MTVYIVMKTVGYMSLDMDSPIEEIDSVYLDEHKAELRLAELDATKAYHRFNNWITQQEVTI